MRRSIQPLAALLGAFLIGSLGTIRAEAQVGEPSDSDVRRLVATGLVNQSLAMVLESEGWAPVLISFQVDGVVSRTPDASYLDPAEQAAIHSAADQLLMWIGDGNFELRHRYRSLNAIAGKINTHGLAQLVDHRDRVLVELEIGGRGQLSESVPLVGLDSLHLTGLTGKGVTVAVLDSGLDTDHPDLADDLIEERCFCSSNGCCPYGAAGAGSAEDDNGHGTNVTGIITSAGTIAPLGGAPDVDIIAIKVLDSNNEFCCTGDLIAGLDYLLTERPDVDLINLSLGLAQSFSGDCDSSGIANLLIRMPLDSLRSNGALAFAASGDLPLGDAMTSPACLSSVVSVGAVYDADVGSVSMFGCTDGSTSSDQVPCWSSSSTSLDLLAAGAPVTSTGLGGGTSTYFGTSQSSPLAVACAAALLEADPTLTPDDIEAALLGSPVLITDPKNGQAFPRVDCVSALAMAVPPQVPLSAPSGLLLLLAASIGVTWLFASKTAVG